MSEYLSALWTDFSIVNYLLAVVDFIPVNDVNQILACENLDQTNIHKPTHLLFSLS